MQIYAARLQVPAESLRDFGILFSDVSLFANVLLEIVELTAGGQFPVAGSHGFQFITTMIEKCLVWSFRALFAKQYRSGTPERQHDAPRDRQALVLARALEFVCFPPKACS